MEIWSVGTTTTPDSGKFTKMPNFNPWRVVCRNTNRQGKPALNEL